MEDLISRLEKRLKNPLPGKQAYQLMKPRLPDGQSVNFTNKENPKPGAVLILLYPESGAYYFPLIQRPAYEGVHSGQIALPGGKSERYDRNLYDTALRETEEEIGVPREDIRVIGALSQFYVAASNYEVLPVIGYIREKPVFVPDHVEVDEVIIGSVDRLTDRKYHKEKEMRVRGFPLTTPYFDMQEKVVWGATAMMLSELVYILDEL